MQTERGEFYIRHDYNFYDSGILAALPHAAVLVYDLLRRFVWRSDSPQKPLVAALRAEGYVVSSASQSTLAALLGYERPKTVSDNLLALKRLGWVRTVQSRGGETAYVLGEMTRDGMGNRYEGFYADAMGRLLLDDLEAEAKSKHGPSASLYALPAAERASLCRAFLLPILDDKGEVSVEYRGENSIAPATPPGGNPPPPLAEIRHPPWRKSANGNREGTSYPPPNAENPLNPSGSRGSSTPSEPGGGVPPGQTTSPSSGESDPSGGLPVPPVTPPARLAPLDESEEEAADGAKGGTPPTGAATASRRKPTILPDLTRKRQEFAEASKAAATHHLREDSKAERMTASRKGQGSDSKKVTADIAKLEGVWIEKLSELFPGVVVGGWSVADKVQIKQLLGRYAVEVLSDTLAYVLREWGAINTRIFKGTAKVPSVPLIARMHTTFVTEAQLHARSAAAKEEIDRWVAEHPYEAVPEAMIHRWKGTSA